MTKIHFSSEELKTYGVYTEGVLNKVLESDYEEKPYDVWNDPYAPCTPPNCGNKPIGFKKEHKKNDL